MQILVLCIFFLFHLEAKVYPIQFSIPECKIVDSIPEKSQDFAFLIPGASSTYVYPSESEYYQDYQHSYFGYTWKKAGWDCMRHYEILASGCIPYFAGLDQMNAKTMIFFPKELVLEAMQMPGLTILNIDHQVFDFRKYNEILSKILEHTRQHLTCKAMAKYVLDTLGYQGDGNILFLLNSEEPDYLPCTLLIGLKELLGNRVIDIPKLPYIYTNYQGNIKDLYGKGMSYTKIIDDVFVDRSDISRRIQNREFDLIFYGSVHRGLPFHKIVWENYSEEEIIYFCGEDGHICEYKHLPHIFVREFDALGDMQ